MQNQMNGLGNLINSPEFKRKTTYITQDATKMSFKWIGIGIKSLIEFIKSMIGMVLGK